MLNKEAIDFTLPDNFGKMHSLKDYIGKKIILYFYPKDNTSGCTNQALEFKRLYNDFIEENCVIIGISKDSTASHCKFINKYELPFILLSDVNGDILSKYGVYQEKSMYGRKYMGIVRTTFVIDEKGIVKKIYEKANASKNPQEVLDYILKK